MTPKFNSAALALTLLICGFSSDARAVDGVIHTRFSSGIRATIYSADYLSGRVTPISPSRGLMRLEDGTSLSVVTDVGDALIYNKGDGTFHSYDVPQVAAVLEEIDMPGLELDVEVFLMPFPRTDVLVSSVDGRRVFLSPQVVEIGNANAAYVVAHEIGHAFQHRYLQGLTGDEGENYRRLRGIDDADRFNAFAAHHDRPSEIFAEDFRVLFGGPTAYFDGRIENVDITPPTRVPGLEAYFRTLIPSSSAGAIADVTNYPNPFNPSTEIKVTLDAALVGTGEALTIRIYDVRGALVRDLMVGEPASSELRVRWDGRDANGRDVASAMYFGVVDFGGERKTQKLLLVK